MFLSTLCRPIGMIISLLYTPVLLNYLGEEPYGVWSTMLSIINWITYFDVGIGQGLRNSLSASIATEDKEKSTAAVTTGYVALSAISAVACLIGIILFCCLDINALFNTTISVRSALLVSFVCICFNFVLSLSKTILYATQQAEKVGYMTVLTQLINLIGILILSLFSSGSLLYVAIVIGLSGVFVNIIFTAFSWKKYPFLIPKRHQFKRSELKAICNIGIKFFIVQIAYLVLYTTDNMIITQLFGPEYVTPYHTVYAAFGIVNGLFAAFIAPLWSKYTVAQQHGDYAWIKRTVIRLDLLLIPVALILVVGVLCFVPISRIWLQRELNYENGLIACMALYYFISMWCSIYSTVQNGMSKVNLQLILGVIAAVANIPLSIVLGSTCGLGTTGVCLATCICMLATAIPITISSHRMINKLVKQQNEENLHKG